MSNLPTKAVGDAMTLTAAVHDYDSESVRVVLERSSRSHLHAVIVSLAAMVNVDATPSELLAWNDTETDPVELMPHGTHAAFNRHKGRGETPCPSCADGERRYQRLRNRRRRNEQRVAG